MRAEIVEVPAEVGVDAENVRIDRRGRSCRSQVRGDGEVIDRDPVALGVHELLKRIHAFESRRENPSEDCGAGPDRRRRQLRGAMPGERVAEDETVCREPFDHRRERGR